MKQILTWSEFTELYPREDGFDCDKYSRIIIKYFLQWGFGTYDVNVQFTEGYNCSDLYWEHPRTGAKFIGEIKDRYTYNSNSFNDHIVEDVKVKSLSNKLKQGVAGQAALFSIYNDGVIKLTRDLFKQGSFLGQQNSVCPRTTTLGDNTLIDKILYRFKPDVQYYFRFEYNETENQYKTIFSDKPFIVSGPEFIESIQLL